MERILAMFETVGASPLESDEDRLRRSLHVGVTLLIAVMGAGWGLVYVSFGEPLAGAIPLAYSFLALASVVTLGITRRYDLFRTTQFALWLVLPFVLMAVLGGFVLSSVVAAWAFVVPLAALVFATRREAIVWFALFVLLLVLFGTVAGASRDTNNLPAWLRQAMFIVNVGAISGVVFLAIYAFVRQRDRAYGAVHQLFGQYLSPRIARTLLAQPERAALGGEIRDVSALFADLQGFTGLTESRPPQQTVEIVNRYFGAAVPVIFANGGTIIQFAGDAIVAVWNAPVEQARHALGAARAALAMQDAIEGIVRSDGSLPRFRVGIATGAALVGNVGSPQFRNYVAHGDAVNVAARLQTEASAGEVVISATTYALIRDVARVRPLGRLRVKGKTEEVEAFALESLAEMHAEVAAER